MKWVERVGQTVVSEKVIVAAAEKGEDYRNHDDDDDDEEEYWCIQTDWKVFEQLFEGVYFPITLTYNSSFRPQVN